VAVSFGRPAALARVQGFQGHALALGGKAEAGGLELADAAAGDLGLLGLLAELDLQLLDLGVEFLDLLFVLGFGDPGGLEFGFVRFLEDLLVALGLHELVGEFLNELVLLLEARLELGLEAGAGVGAAEGLGLEVLAALLEFDHVVELGLDGLLVLLLLALQVLDLLPGHPQLVHQVLDLRHVVVLSRDLLECFSLFVLNPLECLYLANQLLVAFFGLF
jgi:hypothetical protein